jgi:ribonuclease P protein component
VQRQQRLRREREFAAVYQRGRSWSNQVLAVRLLPNALAQSRFGFAVGKRVGKAVTRNQVKRRLREAVRALDPAGGWDVVIIARPAAAASDFAELRSALASLFRRAGLQSTHESSDDDRSGRRDDRSERAKRETIGSSRKEDATE